MAVLFNVDLNFMPIPDVLQWIDMNRLSCVVNVTLENGNDMNLCMENGKIVFVSSQKKGYRLGEYLVKCGAMSEVKVFQALTESRNSGLSFTRYLVENGLIPAAELAEHLGELVEKILIEVFISKNGSVAVTSPLPEIVANGPVRLETGRIIFDAVRIFDEMNRDSRQRDEAVEAINQRLYQEDFQLPVLPGMLMQLISLMEDEKTTFQDMAKLIMTDQVLISRILKIANSALYAASGEVDSIHYAIVRLGMREIMNIVTGIQINSLQNKDIPQEKLQQILDDALKTAFVASGLARHCRLDPEEAFLGGLLLDLGKTVILSVAKDFEIEQLLLEDLLNSRHAEIGSLIARKWNYPESIQNLIRYHHKRNFGGIVNPMIALIQLADQVVQAGSESGLDPELLQAIGVDQETVNDVFSKSINSFNQIKAM
ncbi:HDOD domain-containing protein [Geobacter pelophilus]|uniref:HDOD domain-containing protein n=1 Tax=Geoanaerobacter pelophilus TaxID=60036 RepID=A0AAW4L663_9BACT|nr:HDOD domain-containing protein [Geoanaerobacter pelophilus]MBT0663307.1 HDOD domain-containing protein [Geoanaerobacter pelophilus]